MINMHELILALSVVLLLSGAKVPVGGQMTEQGIRNQIRSELRSQLHLKSDQFLAVQRDESLEQKLAIASGKPGMSLYRVSQAGDEIKGHIIVHHIFTDSDPTYIVAVSTDGSMYRIHGFRNSSAEFEKLIATTSLKVGSTEEAESVVDFYRDVNPQNQPLSPISSLLDLKQAAERQCQTKSFDEGERAFDVWWNQAKSLYAATPFNQTALRSNNGYIVEWDVLSAPSPSLCGGDLLHARLEVGSDGQVGKLTFVPLGKP